MAVRPPPPSGPSDAPAEGDFDALMQAHLTRVFGERDGSRRLGALKEIYAEDAVVYEPDATARGYEAIAAALKVLYARRRSSSVFPASGPALGHNGVARLHWRAGPPNGSSAVTGTDVAFVENGRIRSLYVFVDPALR